MLILRRVHILAQLVRSFPKLFLKRFFFFDFRLFWHVGRRRSRGLLAENDQKFTRTLSQTLAAGKRLSDSGKGSDLAGFDRSEGSIELEKSAIEINKCNIEIQNLFMEINKSSMEIHKSRMSVHE